MTDGRHQWLTSQTRGAGPTTPEASRYIDIQKRQQSTDLLHLPKNIVADAPADCDVPLPAFINAMIVSDPTTSSFTSWDSR